MSYNSPPDKSFKMLQNKVIDGGVASDKSAIYLPANSTANLAENERKVASIAYDTTLEEIVIDKGAGFVSIGGGGGAVDSVNGETGVVVLDADDVGAASQALDNLAATAVNVSIVPAVDLAISMGSNVKQFANVFVNNVAGPQALYLQSDTDGIGLYANNETVSLGSYNSVVAPSLLFENADASQSVGLKAPDALGASQVYVLPSADGSSGDVLSTNGAGQLSFIPAGGGGATTALDNLTTTSINQNLIPDIAATKTLGTLAKPWSTTYTNTVDSSATSSLSVQANGGDLNLYAETQDHVLFSGSIGHAPRLKFQDFSGGNFTGLQGPAVATDITFILPSADGSPGNALATDGAGNLNFTSSLGATEIISPSSLLLDADAGLIYMWCTDEAFALKSYNGVVSPTLELRDKNDAFFVGLKAPDILAGTQTYTLPLVDGNSGDILSTDGSGQLSFIAAASGANTALSNLAAVAASADLNPGIDQTFNLGAPAKAWNEMYVNQINSSAETIVMTVSGRRLYDQAGQGALRFTTTERTLQGSSGVATLDWLNHDLLDGSSVQSLTWSGRRLIDSAGANSLHWQDRELLNTSSNTMLQWGSTNLVSKANLIFDKANAVIQTPDGASGSDHLSILTGDSAATAQSGNIVIQSGDGFASGFVSMKSGVVTEADITSGSATLATGNSNLGPSGSVFINTGGTNPSGGSAAGNISIETGVGTPGGTIQIRTGNSVITGNNGPNMELYTGDAQVAASGGNFVFTAGQGEGSGHQGDVDMTLTRAIKLSSLAADPTGDLVAGTIYYNTGTNKIKMYNGATWETITSV